MQGMTSEYATYLQNLVKQAGQIDKERAVFGASKHDYRLNPVISLAEVRQYEQAHNIKLPSEYVFFVTQVGNGGAGPYYGIYGIHTDKYALSSYGGTPLLSSKLTQAQWTETLAPMDDDDCSDDVFDQIEEIILSGTTSIGTQGCSYEILAISAGAEENRIFYTNCDWDSQAMPFDTQMTFLEWYENFFKEIIIGNSVASYGFCKIQTQEELIQSFAQATKKAEQEDCLNSFFRFPKLEQTTIDFIQSISNDDLSNHKLSLLLKYDTPKGLQLFDTLLTENPKTAISQSVRIPKAYLPSYYETFLHLLYTLKDGSEKCGLASSYYDVLLFRLKDCPQIKAKDIIPFLKQEQVSDNDLCTAFFILKNVSDKTEYIDIFIDFMLHGSHQVARSALQAISDTAHPALQAICPTLWEQYTDDMMRGNLKRLYQANGLSIPITKKSKGLPK